MFFSDSIQLLIHGYTIIIPANSNSTTKNPIKTKQKAVFQVQSNKATKGRRIRHNIIQTSKQKVPISRHWQQQKKKKAGNSKVCQHPVFVLELNLPVSGQRLVSPTESPRVLAQSLATAGSASSSSCRPFGCCGGPHARFTATIMIIMMSITATMEIIMMHFLRALLW